MGRNYWALGERSRCEWVNDWTGNFGVRLPTSFKGALDIGGHELKVRPTVFVCFSHSQLSECRSKLGSLLDLTVLVSLPNRCDQVIEEQGS